MNENYDTILVDLEKIKQKDLSPDDALRLTILEYCCDYPMESYFSRSELYMATDRLKKIYGVE